MFILLKLKDSKLFIFTNGLFANNKDLSSQLSFVIVLATEHCTGKGYNFKICSNIIH
jgi:hypothetical protein